MLFGMNYSNNYIYRPRRGDREHVSVQVASDLAREEYILVATAYTLVSSRIHSKRPFSHLDLFAIFESRKGMSIVSEFELIGIDGACPGGTVQAYLSGMRVVPFGGSAEDDVSK